MAQTDASLLLVSVREQLLQLLARLDEAAESLVAAHLAAAVDALEDRLKSVHAEQSLAVREQPLDIVTRALIDHYGEDAERVARHQLAVSQGDALVAWACVVERIEAAKTGNSVQ